MTEQQPYDLIQRFDSFELRHYPEHVLVEVVARGPFAQAGSMGFQPLVSYISGRNLDRKKFEMTAPVLQTPNASDDEHRVAFVLPAGVSLGCASSRRWICNNPRRAGTPGGRRSVRRRLERAEIQVGGR